MAVVTKWNFKLVATAHAPPLLTYCAFSWTLTTLSFSKIPFAGQVCTEAVLRQYWGCSEAVLRLYWTNSPAADRREIPLQKHQCWGWRKTWHQGPNKSKQSTFFDVRIFNSQAAANCISSTDACHRRDECEKRRAYELTVCPWSGAWYLHSFGPVHKWRLGSVCHSYI